MSDLSSFLSTRSKEWSAKLWDGFIEAVQARLAPLEEQLDIQRQVTDAIIARGLTVIEQELAPIVAQAGEILDQNTAELEAKIARFEAKVTGGTVLTTSASSVSLSNGATISLVIAAADREFFAATPYVAVSRASTVANWAIGKVNSFNRATGALSLTLEQVTGAGGPYADWIITSLPGATLLQKAYYEQTLALRGEVAADKLAVSDDRVAADAAKAIAVTARDQSVSARDDAEGALASFMSVYLGRLAADPATGEVGQFYFNTTLNVARVYAAGGWHALFNVSLGGIRQDFVTATAGQTTFTVSGGFTYINVWLNGALLRAGVDYTTATPAFTLADPAVAGDEIAWMAYYNTDATDFYSKADADARFAHLAHSHAISEVSGLTAALAGKVDAANGSLTDPTIVGAITEDIYTITDGAAFEIDPGNGSIQSIALGASRTPKATNFANGESITLAVDDGTAYTLTWTDTTFGPSGVKWMNGTAPTLATTGLTWITLWKVGGQVYGSSPGASS